MFPSFNIYFSILIILVIHFLQPTQSRRRSSHCNPSSCGNIRNISYPFRLRTDPQRCGVSSYELLCENNTTVMYTRSNHMYHVQSINYDNYTIRFADSSLIRNDTCSFPQYSQNELEFVTGYPFSVRRFDDADVDLARPVTFLSCKFPVYYSVYTKMNNCVEKGNGSSNNIYVKVGQLDASQVLDMCTIDLVVMLSMPFRDGNIFSVSEMHRYLLYGFDVSWYIVFCGDECKGEESYCQWDGSNPICIKRFWKHCIYHQLPGCRGDLIIQLSLRALKVGLVIIGIITTAKCVLGIPILLGLLIYKLRRRHMSMFDGIEHFLLHQNNSAPIRPETANSLNWEKKYEIAVGVARGIEYLHRGCDIQILHFDIKPHNILLDDNFIPKISDFGLAKFFSTEKDIVTLTAARGTIGYVAPELIHRSIGGISYKADVYSFGMMLMELMEFICAEFPI